MRIDLHCHSTVSDGTDTPSELVARAHEAGLTVMALTDHDTFGGIPEAREAARAMAVRLVPGVELSTELESHSVHLLAYGCDMTHPGLRDEMRRLREGRSGRLPAMCRQLTESGLPLTVEDVMEQVGDSPSVGRPHVADALVAKGYVTSRDEAFAEWLDESRPGYVVRYAVDLEKGIDLVHEAGGAAVIAHPWGRGSADVLTEEVLAALVNDHDLDGVEVDHEDHDADVREQLRRVARSLGVVTTGSSDHHGTGKPHIHLGINTTEPEQFEALEARVRLHGGTIDIR